MAGPATVLVIDIGKTNAKVALIDAATLAEIDVLTTPNRVRPGPPYAHADVAALWRFILASIGTLEARHGVGAVVTTTHACAAALIDAGGELTLPILDYEDDAPAEFAADYDALRPAFAESGSPCLPAGLNLGAQLYWQSRRFPAAFARTAAILTYPQYWGFRLSGVASLEVTSLGSHSDLWNPHAGRISSLVAACGWQHRLPPLRRAGDILGPVTPAVAAATGLDPATPVLCGIHDSNASLLSHLATRRPPFSVVSTGTWVIAMAIGGRPVTLDPARDTLINVDARGVPVPSARFMGGREWSRLMQGRAICPTPAAAEAVLSRGIMLLPAVEPGSGPFAGCPARWSLPEADIPDAERAVAASWYLALMTGVCLDLIGAEGPACVEGPFAANADYTRMLAATLPAGVIPVTGIGTSTGAALLALAPSDDRPAGGEPADATVTLRSPRLAAYAARWRNEVGGVPSP